MAELAASAQLMNVLDSSEFDACPLAMFKTLVGTTLGVVAQDPRFNESQLAPVMGALGEATTKRAFLALSAVALEAARADAPASQAAATLEEHGLVNSEKLAVFATAYEKLRPQLRLALGKSLGASLPRLVDVQWRLDYVVRTSDPRRASPLVPVYYVKLFVASAAPRFGAAADVAASRALREIDLALSVEQMQDLLHTVRDANHQTARIQQAGGAASAKS